VRRPLFEVEAVAGVEQQLDAGQIGLVRVGVGVKVGVKVWVIGLG